MEATWDDNQNQNRSEGRSDKRIFTDAYKDLKKLYKYGKKAIEIARWLFNFIPGGPLTLGAIIIGILIILMLFSVFFGFMSPIPGGSPPSLPDPSGRIVTIPGLTLTLNGPESVDNGENLEYTVNVSYDPTVANIRLEDILVYTLLPQNTAFVSATGAYIFEDNEIAWPMSQNQGSFSFTLRPTAPDVEIITIVYARDESGSLLTAPPTTDSCGGKYDIALNPMGANFGDPSCSFTKDSLFAFLTQIDPANATKWYAEIVPCTSGFDPNHYAVTAKRPTGAWGLFGLGQGEGGGSFFGDVAWEAQATNAVTYNNEVLGGDFSFWDCSS